MRGHLSPHLILLLILRPIKINKVAYFEVHIHRHILRTCTLTEFHSCQIFSPQQGLTSLMRSHKTRSARDRSIPHSWQMWVSTKSSISQLTFFYFIMFKVNNSSQQRIVVSRNSSCPAVSSTMFPPTWASCGYCDVTFVSPFINLRHPRNFKSHTSRRGTLYKYTYIYTHKMTPGGWRHVYVALVMGSGSKSGTRKCVVCGRSYFDYIMHSREYISCEHLAGNSRLFVEKWRKTVCSSSTRAFLTA